jgi:hypothetical protein
VVDPSGRAGPVLGAERARPLPSENGAPHRGLRHRRRHAEPRARRSRRIGGLALLAALRLGRLLRRAARQPGPRALAHRAATRAAPRLAPLPSRHARARDGARGRGRAHPHRGFHAAAPRGVRPRARRGGRRGARRHGARSAAADGVRRAPAVAAAPRRRRRGARRSGRGAAPLAALVRPRGGLRASHVRGRGGAAHPVHAHVVPLAPCAAGADRPARGDRGHRAVLDGVVRGLHPHRPVARRGRAVARHAEGAHLRAHRRRRRRRDDLAPGADRRRPQLGLPPLLAARRDARRLRRGDGLPLPGRGGGPLAGARGVAPAAGDARVPGGRLGPAGRGDLGDPRRAPAVHALEGDGVGRVRPRAPRRAPLRARGARRALAEAAQGDPRGCVAAATIPSEARSSSDTARRISTRACS